MPPWSKKTKPWGVPLTPEYRIIELQIYGVYPTGKYTMAKIRAMLGFIGERLAAEQQTAGTRAS